MADRTKMKGRRSGSSFVAMPHALLNSENFSRLTPAGVKLLMDIASQYKGKNNGDLCTTISVMKERGWKSASTLDERISELLHYGFITKTRQGGRNQCSLYALTWQPINECNGKLDIPEAKVAPGQWKISVEKWQPKRKRKTVSHTRSAGYIGPDYTAARGTDDRKVGNVPRRSNQSGENSPNLYPADRTPSYNYTKRSVSTFPKESVGKKGEKCERSKKCATGHFERSGNNGAWLIRLNPQSEGAAA
ncbi:MAG: hypothetical protein HON68_02695 [Gammaproteobacteria bacterium]|jgi:hypothetical protein|nr:hypothetical protein [Gammaproteobacteria bacterium]MBT5235835.1 hypothetical protein [Candidatus Neomarinimicrobiota bacterium]MBT3490393.1 hypothetical protein [Gammaproteobacteria bacterium]MBT3718141.1 hypothetical protein [Gammaproteobacteria bacterium]MBT3845545.1 hypothetical protein [Gammaproteobacteria bacterium]